MTHTPPVPPPPQPPPEADHGRARLRSHFWTALGLTGRSIRAWRERRTRRPRGNGYALTGCVVSTLALAAQLAAEDVDLADAVRALVIW